MKYGIRMRLLRTLPLGDECAHLELQDFQQRKRGSYAILSHTRDGDNEVLFADVQNGKAHTKGGFAKVRAACKQARREDYEYIWIDSVCIDKSSSAELSEAIHSM